MIASKFYRLVVGFALAITFLMILLFCSCSGKKQFTKYALLHKGELAELCADNFKPETRLKEGRTDTIIKLEYITSDSVPCPPVEAKTGRTTTNYVKCPPAKIITTTLHKTDTLIKPDAAREYALQYQLKQSVLALKQSEKDLKKETANKNQWRLTSVISIVAAIALLVLMFARS